MAAYYIGNQQGNFNFCGIIDSDFTSQVHAMIGYKGIKYPAMIVVSKTAPGLRWINAGANEFVNDNHFKFNSFISTIEPEGTIWLKGNPNENSVREVANIIPDMKIMRDLDNYQFIYWPYELPNRPLAIKTNTSTSTYLIRAAYMNYIISHGKR